MSACSPLSTWFAPGALARFARHRETVLLRASRDGAWRHLAPGFTAAVALVERGLPFQVAAHRRYDRTGRPERLRPALAAGKTVFVPQVHQVLPRVARLMVALRAAVMGPGREECSFLFLVEGTGREGLGLHHDGEVESVWVQLAGRRTVTLGPPVPRRAPEELPDTDATGPGYATLALAPGTFLYLPPRTPHRVVCHQRSLALSLTWGRRRGRPPRSGSRAHAEALADWDVTSGRVQAPPARHRARLWAQVPAVPLGRGRGPVDLVLPGGAAARLPAAARRLARHLPGMAALSPAAAGPALPALLAHGIVAPHDLPIAVLPEDPRALDGWRFR
jgi:hypothetical protein